MWNCTQHMFATPYYNILSRMNRIRLLVLSSEMQDNVQHIFSLDGFIEMALEMFIYPIMLLFHSQYIVLSNQLKYTDKTSGWSFSENTYYLKLISRWNHPDVTQFSGVGPMQSYCSSNCGEEKKYFIILCLYGSIMVPLWFVPFYIFLIYFVDFSWFVGNLVLSLNK